MHLALRAVKQNQLNMVKRWLIVTLGLGLAFTFCQFLGYNALIQKGVFFADKTTPSGSFFYAITFLHLAHVAFGILALMFTAGKSILEKYNSGNYLGISVCAIYWHFLDGLWIYLFVFLAIFR
jgi:cytochrome c oxidase subunit 3